MVGFWAGSFPQEAALLYRKLGYNFLCFSDHNRTHVHCNKLCNEKTTKRFFRKNLARFEKYFPGWLPKPVKGADGVESYRLDTFDEMSKRLNKPGEFLLMSGCEWHNDTDFQLHCNVTNTFAEQHPYRFGSVETSFEDMFLQYEKKIGLDNDTSMFTVNLSFSLSSTPPVLFMLPSFLSLSAASFRCCVPLLKVAIGNELGLLGELFQGLHRLSDCLITD